jgi:hypothetical protein
MKMMEYWVVNLLNFKEEAKRELLQEVKMGEAKLLEAKKELLQEVKMVKEDAKKELLHEVKMVKEEGEAKLLQIKQEGEAKLLNIKDEVIKSKEEAKKELLQEVKMVKDESKSEALQSKDQLHKMEAELKEAKRMHLSAVNKLNIRGALEHIRAKIAAKNKIPLSADPPDDKVLGSLYADADFHSRLIKGLQVNHLKEEDVRKCFGGLYHEASKRQHGKSGTLTIYEDDWAINERFSLAAIFTYHKIPYVILDGQGSIIKEFDVSMFDAY